jgi:hypothetical protein
MSDSLAETKVKSGIGSDEVLEFLKANPNFLQKHPEACEYLLPPQNKSSDRKVADFQTYLISRLRADKDAVLQTTKEIVENSRANMNNQHRVHKAILLLLEANNFEDFIHTITMDISAILDVDITSLVVESNGRDIPHVSTTGIRIIPEGTVDKWMGDKSVLLQDNIQGIETIYGGGATLVASQALLRVDISMDTPPAILAFGSRDPGLFHTGQATDQINFLARVVERCFRAWLNLPR